MRYKIYLKKYGIRFMRIDTVKSDFIDALFSSYKNQKEFSFRNVVRIDHEFPENPQEIWSEALFHYREFLRLAGLKEEIKFDNTFDFTNRQTNALHRIFTRAHKELYNGHSITKTEEMQFHLHTINDKIHTIESRIINERQTKFDLRWFEVEGSLDKADRIWLENLNVEVDDRYDVTAMPYILGKNFKIAFTDYDDIEEDVMNIGPYTHFSLKIDFDNKIKNLYRSQEFNEWKKKNNYVGPVGGIPIGNIVWFNPFFKFLILNTSNWNDTSLKIEMLELA